MNPFDIGDGLANSFDQEPLDYDPEEQILDETGEEPDHPFTMDSVPLEPKAYREWVREFLKVPGFAQIRNANRAANAALSEAKARFILINIHLRNASTYVGMRKYEKAKAKKKKGKKKKKSRSANTKLETEQAEPSTSQGGSQPDAVQQEKDEETIKANKTVGKNNKKLRGITYLLNPESTEFNWSEWYDNSDDEEDEEERRRNGSQMEKDSKEPEAGVRSPYVTFICQPTPEVEAEIDVHFADCEHIARSIIEIFIEAMASIGKLSKQLHCIPNSFVEIHAIYDTEGAKIGILIVLVKNWIKIAHRCAAKVVGYKGLLKVIESHKGIAQEVDEDVYKAAEDMYDDCMTEIHQKKYKKDAMFEAEEKVDFIIYELDEIENKCRKDEGLFECLARCPYGE